MKNKIKHYEAVDNGLHCEIYIGLDKTQINEIKATAFVRADHQASMYGHATANEWQSGVLIVHYATNAMEYDRILEALRKTLDLPKDHPERSLLY